MEESEIAHTGTDEELIFNGQYSETMNKGAQSNSDAYGEKVQTNVTGAQENSNKFGNVQTTSGAQNVDTTNKVAAFNSTNFEDSEKEISQIGEKIDTVSEHIDTENRGRREDSVTENARTDTHSEGARTDTVEHSAKDDTISKTYGSKNTTASHIHGNIGVTTNQEMIKAELELRKINFFDYVVSLIVKELCTYSEF